MSQIPYNGDGGYLSKNDIIKGMAAEIEMLKKELNISNQMKFTYMDDCTKMLAENDSLKAAVERWKRNHAVVIEDRNTVLSSLVNVKAEVERLRAASFVTAVPVEQYERVIKAGQAMADVCGWHGTYEAAEELVKAWEAAKDGKPSV